MLKFGWICSRVYGVIGVLSWGSPVSPNFQRPLVMKLYVLVVKECPWWPLSACQVWWGSDFTCPARVAKSGKFFCLLVCLSITLVISPLWMTGLWMTKFECMILLWRHWCTETVFTPLDRGRFVVMHPFSTFSIRCQMATPQNTRVQK